MKEIINQNSMAESICTGKDNDYILQENDLDNLIKERLNLIDNYVDFNGVDKTAITQLKKQILSNLVNIKITNDEFQSLLNYIEGDILSYTENSTDARYINKYFLKGTRETYFFKSKQIQQKMILNFSRERLTKLLEKARKDFKNTPFLYYTSRNLKQPCYIPPKE